MEAILKRKPLTEREKRARLTTVCVTGGAGYVASHLIVRLLAAGHTVHATYRPAGDDTTTLAWLRSLPSVEHQLKWFPADLLKEGSFDEAIQGCEVVFHTAAVVDIGMPESKGMARCVRPAVHGVANVLGSVNRTPSVKRVIMTSSLAAVVDHRPEGHVYTEADWCLLWPTAGVPYLTAKTISEWEAWALAGQQHRWKLVCVHPTNVWGPPVTTSEASANVRLARNLLDGSYYPYFIPIDQPTVDVRDVAAAHTLAMATEQASGRYLVVERSGQSITDVLALMRQRYPGYKIPFRPLPVWLGGLFGRLAGSITPAYVRLAYHSRSKMSGARAEKELGLQLIPLEMTLDDMVAQFVASGELKDLHAGSASGTVGQGVVSGKLWRPVLRQGCLALAAVCSAAALAAVCGRWTWDVPAIVAGWQ